MCIYCVITHVSVFIFFFNDTATTEIYTLSLHDALPIFIGSRTTVAAARSGPSRAPPADGASPGAMRRPAADRAVRSRSEEHTSELQSRQYLVCRLLLEKKKKNIMT